MLMNHSDLMSDGILGIAEFNRFPTDQQFPLIGLVQPV